MAGRREWSVVVGHRAEPHAEPCAEPGRSACWTGALESKLADGGLDGVL